MCYDKVMKNRSSKAENLLRNMMQVFPLMAQVHKAEDEGYWVECAQLGGCFAEGNSVREALHNFKFAIFEYFDISKKHQKALKYTP